MFSITALLNVMADKSIVPLSKLLLSNCASGLLLYSILQDLILSDLFFFSAVVTKSSDVYERGVVSRSNHSHLAAPDASMSSNTSRPSSRRLGVVHRGFEVPCA